MASLMTLVNPHERKKRRRSRRRANPHRRRRSSRRHSNPRRRRRSTYRRRNPIGGVSSQALQRNLTAAATAAIGVIGLNVAWGYLPIPANWKVGNVQYLVKGLGAVALGQIAHKMGASRATANLFTLGALTVIAATLGTSLLKSALPNVAMGFYNPGFVLNGMPGSGDDSLGYYFDNNLGMYIPMAKPGSPFPIGGRGPCPAPRVVDRRALRNKREASMGGFESDPLSFQDAYGDDF